MQTQYHLLKTRRFLPLFLTQFLNAFNDNLFKNALIILITYKIAETSSFEQSLVSLISGIFVLPFFLFSATAGQLADKFEKSKLIKIIKFFEIICMTFAVLGFAYNNIYILLSAIFLTGTHSAFFGPLKYALLPEHLKSTELIGGNALIEAGTFMAILIGSNIGGIAILSSNGLIVISILLMLVALLGWISSLYVPKTQIGQPHLKINANILKETWQIIQNSRTSKEVFFCILGISWFWLVGITFITQFPIFTKNVLFGNSYIVILFFSTFSIGIAFGSLICNRLLKGTISSKYVPLGILGMSIFIFDLYFAAHTSSLTQPERLIGFSIFFSHLNNIRILLDVFLLSVCGGIYIVPLYAIMQEKSSESHRARIIAANNILNALFMVVSSLGCIVIFKVFHLTDAQLFLILAILNLFVALYTVKLLPETTLKWLIKNILNYCYQVQLNGIENYYQGGQRAVIVVNHTSFLDAVLLAVFLPDKLTFAVNTQVAQKWWMKPVTKMIDLFLLDPSNPLAIKSLIKEVRQEKRCVIFPEGRITVTGSLMKVYEGPGMIADQARANIIPIRIDGAQYTIFSRLRGKIKLRWFPKITITIQPPTQFNIPDCIIGKARRGLIGKKLYDIMSNLMFESSCSEKTLFTSLLEARKIHGNWHRILEDHERISITYNELIKRICILGLHLEKQTKVKEVVGILLANSVANVICFFALQSKNRIPAMINYTVGIKNIQSACESGNMRIILTSARFIKLAKLEPILEELQKNYHIIFLEELPSNISFYEKLKGYLQSQITTRIFQNYPQQQAHDPAVILFTSGSEGLPKGVVLSHQNIQANRFQLAARLDFSAQDVVFNPLPMFHSFGLNAGTILPILSGIKTVLYPSPLHYRIIPELIYEYDATMTFGTDTFLRNYARFANPYDFYSLRYVLAGAEKLKEDTRDIWMKKFGIRILEGYGATETSPVLSTNTPMQYKKGTVGRFLPGINYKLEPVPGFNSGGRLHVSGPNVMLGYIQNGLLPKHSTVMWYDTGDIVSIDEDQYITIEGRAKRFAKVGGEMVSLTAIENFVATLWPAHVHAVLNESDPRKGEQLILVTNYPDASRDVILSYAKSQGIPEMNIPKKIVTLNHIPLLGSGKINYPHLQEILKKDLELVG